MTQLDPTRMLGVPDVCHAFSGVDVLGADCRIDATVSVMRWGQRSDVLCLGDGVSLYAGTRLVLGDVDVEPCVGMRLGARTIVNVGAYLSGEGGLDIGEDVLIGAHARLLSAGHAIDEGDWVIARNRITRACVVVGDGAWIGAGATVLEGVTIGRGAVVAAGAVVRCDVPDGMIAAGVPARLIRARRLPNAPAEVPASASVFAHTSPKTELWLARWLRLIEAQRVFDASVASSPIQPQAAVVRTPVPVAHTSLEFEPWLTRWLDLIQAQGMTDLSSSQPQTEPQVVAQTPVQVTTESDKSNRWLARWRRLMS